VSRFFESIETLIRIVALIGGAILGLLLMVMTFAV
jgi:hypothetical protein